MSSSLWRGYRDNSLPKVLEYSYNLSDTGTDSESHSLPIMHDASTLALDPTAEPLPLVPTLPASTCCGSQTRPITNHLCKSVFLQRPLEFPHDRQKGAGNGERGRLNIREYVRLVECLEGARGRGPLAKVRGKDNASVSALQANTAFVLFHGLAMARKHQRHEA
jgi:hypothetical protein